jgi:uncharacterized membrane protein
MLVVGLGLATRAFAQIVAVDVTPFSDSRGSCISADGTVVGGVVSQGAQGNAFRWTPASGLVPLPHFAQGDRSFATAASANGSIMVGGRTTGGSSTARAIRWLNTDSNPVVQELPVPAGFDPTFQTEVLGVSGSGSVSVGRVFVSGIGYTAVRWDNLVATTLPDLSGASVAVAVSNDGSKIVGLGGNSIGRASLWTSAGQHLLPHGEVWDTSAAQAISGNGQIIAGSVYDISSNVRQLAYWPTPDSNPVTIGPMNLNAFIVDLSGDGSIAVGNLASGQQGFVWTQATGLVSPAEYFLSRGVDTSAWSNLMFSGVSDDGLRFVGSGSFEGGNRGFVVTVPGPGGAALACIALLGAGRRRSPWARVRLR